MSIVFTPISLVAVAVKWLKKNAAIRRDAAERNRFIKTGH